jgi:hypothetical protein
VKQGWQIVDEAWATFDEWLAAQSDEVQELSILEQIELYSAHTHAGAA